MGDQFFRARGQVAFSTDEVVDHPRDPAQKRDVAPFRGTARLPTEQGVTVIHPPAGPWRGRPFVACVERSFVVCDTSVKRCDFVSHFY
jgi:hypothetical protein